MDSGDQQTGVMDGRPADRKRGRPGNYGPSASVEPMPLAFAPPDDYFNRYQARSSNIVVYPAGNRIRPSTGLVSADGSQDKPQNSVGSENLGAEHMLEVHDAEAESEYQINMEIEENTARQAQRQMRQFTSTLTELCTGFETSKKKIEELGKQVINLEGQIKRWKDKEARWNEQKKEIERERDEAARQAVNEKRSLEQKLDKAAKQYKTGLGSFVAYLANGEGKSLGDYVNELVKETPSNNRAPAPADDEANVMGS